MFLTPHEVILVSTLVSNFTLHLDWEIKYMLNYVTDAKVISLLIVWKIKLKSDTTLTYVDFFEKMVLKQTKYNLTK